jgi:ADP-heptose:LPS heptosyltransferase
LLHPTDDETAALRALAFPEGCLVLHPGSGSSEKNWPSEGFATLARTLGRGRPVLVIEGPADAAACAPVLKTKGARQVRGIPLRILGALLATSSLYVGNDSGVSHLAAAFGAPVLALFGPTNPEVWAPEGPRVRTLVAPAGILHELSADLVLAEAESLLAS